MIIQPFRMYICMHVWDQVGNIFDRKYFPFSEKRGKKELCFILLERRQSWERSRKKTSPICWFPLQMFTRLWLGQAEAQQPELHLHLRQEWQRPACWTHHLLWDQQLSTWDLNQSLWCRTRASEAQAWPPTRRYLTQVNYLSHRLLSPNRSRMWNTAAGTQFRHC